MIGKLIQRALEGEKRTTIEVQVQHVGPDLEFATAAAQSCISSESS